MPKKILIAEDDPVQLSLLSTYLSAESGFEIQECADGFQALEKINLEHPDLILADIRMPKMSGLELCSKIKTAEETKSIPVIILTQFSDPKTALLSLVAGADNFVEKPYSRELLLRKVKEVLNRAQNEASDILRLEIDGKQYSLVADPNQILNYFRSVYEQVVDTRNKLSHMNEILERKVEERTAELKQRTDEVTKSHAEIEQINYLASHHLREPLLRIAGYFGMVLRLCKGKVGSSADRALDEVQAGIHKLETLVNDLLLYSERGESESPVVEADLGELLQEVMEADLSEPIRLTDGAIHIETLPVAAVNPWQIKQVFFNLLDNALKFHGARRPVIFVNSEDLVNEWKISVSDNGVGINERYLETIFLISDRVHAQASFLGAGVGLAVCRKIIERHGGRIWVESREGVGSTFHFTISKLLDIVSRSNEVGRNGNASAHD